jgi:CPA2 family monovalent cation:H+ antiporter-2
VPHETTLIATVAVAFVLAFALGYAADRLRLPPLVGYLVAGVLLGPFTPGVVADGDIATQLAEMGVILLMFGVGLHFSVSDLLAVKAVALPGAVGQIVLATLAGVAVTQLWGWSLGAGLVFGLSLSVASTVVLLKALTERSLLDTPNGRVAVGWLIVEDLAMVLTLVLLPALAGSLGGHPADVAHGHIAAADEPMAMTLAMTLGKVAAFAAIAMLIGPRLVPALLGQVARTGSRELFTLSVLALALGIAYGSAEIFGVSFALGAFFAGVVLSESRFSHKAAADSLPLQDAFSVLFFVSVGMLFDPSILMREPFTVFAVLGLILIAKGIFALSIVLMLRFPVNMGLTVAAALAQVGEFSFILVGLGMTLGLLPAEGRDLILAGALLSIVLNPAVFAAAEFLQRAWTRVAPARALEYGRARYAALERTLAIIRQRNEERERAHDLKVRELVERFPVLALVSEAEQDELLLLFRPKSAAPGERIIRRGERGSSMYFITAGAVEVSVPGQNIRLEPGSFFGEMALVTGERRSADVTAVDYCKFLVLDRRDFVQFTARHPKLRAAIKEMARERREMNQSLREAAANPANAA